MYALLINKFKQEAKG